MVHPRVGHSLLSGSRPSAAPLHPSSRSGQGRLRGEDRCKRVVSFLLAHVARRLPRNGMALKTPPRHPGMRWLAITLMAFVGFGALSFGVAAQSSDDLDVSSKRYIVIDAETGEVLAAQNAGERVAIASLTKIFTTIEALERGELDQLITTKQADVYDASSTLMGFGPDETFTLRDLLYGMMLPSGNDAAHAVARALGETPGATDQEAYENFMAMMNERIKNMGLEDTNLVNPHGWGVDGHYSTARDIATFMMYALRYPEFQEIISTSSYTTSQGGYTVSNTNRLLTDGFSGLIGGKTGYDDDAGYCLIAVSYTHLTLP